MTDFAIRAAPERTAITARIRSLTAADVAVGTAALGVAGLPMLVPSGPANITPADGLITASIVATIVWALKTRHVWRLPLVVAVTIYFVGGLIGAIVGPVPGTGLVALIQDIVLFLWCWGLVNICSTAERFRFVFGAWAYAAIVWTSVLMVGLATGTAALSGQTIREGARTTLTLQDPNYAGNYFFISLMIVWASGRPRRLSARIAASIMLVVAIASTGSNSALASLAAGTVVTLLLVLYRRRGAKASLAVLAGVVLLGYVGTSAISFSGIQRWAQGSKYSFLRDGIGRGDASITERSTILHESLALYRVGSILGDGPNSTKDRMAAAQAPYVKEAHDDYVATLLERGFIGVVGLMLLLGGLLQRSLRAATWPLTRGFHSAVPYPNALFGAVVGTLVGAAFNELLHARHVWALFALVAAVSVWGLEWRSAPES
jgi:O-antigen ligase